MDFSSIFKLQSLWKSFSANHPKFEPFLRAAQGCLEKDALLEMKITRADGSVIESNLKLTREDMALIEDLKSLTSRKQ